MTAAVQVVPRAAVRAFITERANDPAGVDLGKEEFEDVCLTCHRLDSRYIGPALGGNPLLTDAKGLETILRDGRGQDAGRRQQLDRRADRRALIAYTKTLKKAAQ